MQEYSENNPMSLGSKPIGKLLIQYSVPAVIASIVTSLYNIIDSIYIGRGVGAMAIAGLAITFPLMNLVVAFCTVIAVGGSTISSIYLGQKNTPKAIETVNNVIVLSLVHSIVFGGLTLLFLDEILYFFGATSETISYARDFMQVIIYGTPISFMFISLNNMMRATGYPKKAMYSALLSVVVNVTLAPFFIFYFGWGIKGAALATVCGQSAGFAWVMQHFLSHKNYVHLDKRNSWFISSIIKRIYSIGLSPFLMNVCACIVVIFINGALLSTGGVDGNLAVGAYGIVNRTAMLFVMVVFGVTQGMQPILGFNYGANQWDRVKKTLKFGVWIGLAITSIGFILAEIIPEQISKMFTDDEVLIELSSTGFMISMIFFTVVGGQVVIQNFFQSIGKPNISIFLSLTRQLLFLIPTLLIFPSLFGTKGVWWSLAISDMLAFIVAALTLVVIIHRLNKRYAPHNNNI